MNNPDISLDDHQSPMPKPFQNRILHYWTPRAIKQINLGLLGHPWTRNSSKTTVQSRIYLSYPNCRNETSSPVSKAISPQTINLLNPNQSTYTKYHSTETLLTSLYNKLVMAIGHQQVSCLCLLDISAAFDTIDYTILTHRLLSLFGISGTALS